MDGRKVDYAAEVVWEVSTDMKEVADFLQG